MRAAHSSKRKAFWVKRTPPSRPARRKTPPHNICALQSNAQGENGKQNALLLRAFLLSAVFLKKTREFSLSSSDFLSPLTLRQLPFSMGTFRAQNCLKLTPK